MRISPKLWRILGIGLLVLLAAGFVVRQWVVPGLIVRQLEARYAGRVSVGSWWLGRTSSGIRDLALHEGPGADSPVWATAEAIQTDISLGGLLAGRVMPGRITLHAPTITFRLDESGRPLTHPPLKGGKGGSGALPAIVVEDAKVTIDQRGRKPMVVTRVGGTLTSETEGERLAADADDPTWGQWKAEGRFDAGFQAGTIVMTTRDAPADPDKVARIPFVPGEVWDNIVPTGPVDVRIEIALAMGTASPVRVHTEIDLKKTTADVKGLSVVAAETTGKVVVDGGLVTVREIKGRTLGGRIEAPRGTLDFTRAKPAFDLRLDLHQVEIADAPPKWQLKDDGFTSGKLTGHADLKAVLTGGAVDLAGTSGEATIEGGTIQGIPVKSLKLALTAEGGDLQYKTKTEAAWRDRLAVGLIALQAAPPPPPPGAKEDAGKARVKAAVKSNDPPKPKTGIVHLPRSITTQIELEDVDLGKLVARAEAAGIHLPGPMAGRLSLKADATIPLGNLRDIKDYTFRGDATLAGASIDGVDLGNLRARLDLAGGVLDLTDFRGQLVDLPAGGLRGQRPAPTAPVPAQGPLPPGGFRGRLHAEVSPRGRMTAHFEGNALPLGELAAPALPRPTPLSGLLTFDIDADADLGKISDPKAWNLAGHARSERVAYLGTNLDAASASFALKDGRLDVPDLAARLEGKPLTARLSTDLAAPFAFDARLDVAGWDLSDALKLVPGTPKPAPADGVLTARAEARGTLAPRDLQTNGSGRIDGFRAGAVPLGNMPFEWKTEGDTIRVVVAEAHPFGGELSADARVPAKGEGPTRGTVRATGIDTAQLAAQIPGGTLKLSGKAGGTLDLLIPAHPASAENALEANLTLSAPDLTIQGLPAEQVAASVWARKGVVHYEVSADSLGGKIKVKGDVPLGSATPAPAPAARASRLLNAQVRAVGFELGGLWRALGLGKALAPLTGEGAVDANVRVPTDRPGLYTRAVAEVRDLRWDRVALGRMKGTIAMTPTAWRIDPLEGVLLGGSARGSAWNESPTKGPHRSGFEMLVQGVELPRAMGFLPSLSRRVTGFGTLRAAGRVDDSGLHADGEVDVPHARVFGLPLNELRLPAELGIAPGSGAAHLQVRRWSARFAGGRAGGDAQFHLGTDRSFSGSLRLNSIDLETLTRIETEMRHPAAGRVSGTASWSGRDYVHRRGLRGRIDLDLDDASLFELPVFRELSRFLGAAQGGVFEDGDLHATIGERALSVEQFTLEGRLAQLHATGTVGYDTSLNLEVLINTPQVIPETGQALARLIPGLGDAMGRRDQAVSRVGSFLSNKLLKFRVTGTLRSPQVNADATVLVGEAAVGFFGGALKLPLGVLR